MQWQHPRLPHTNAQLQHSLDRFTFRELNRNRGLCFFFLVVVVIDEEHNDPILPHPRPHPFPQTALLGSQHSARCISQVQNENLQVKSPNRCSSAFKKTRRREENVCVSGVDGYCTVSTPTLHTFGIGMPECSEEKKVTWVSHKNLKNQKTNKKENAY